MLKMTKIRWQGIIFNFVFFHSTALICYWLGFNWYVFPASEIIWISIVIIIYVVIPNYEYQKSGTLNLSYNKKLTSEQVATIENSLNNYLQGINETLNIKQEYKIMWTISKDKTEFKVYDVPHKVGHLAINFLKYLAGQY